MKVPVRVIGSPYRGQPVGTVFNVSRGNSRILVATKRVELVDEAAPAEAAKVEKVTQAVAKKTVAKKAAAKKAPAKKTAAKSIRTTQNRSMASKTSTKAD